MTLQEILDAVEQTFGSKTTDRFIVGSRSCSDGDGEHVFILTSRILHDEHLDTTISAEQWVEEFVLRAFRQLQHVKHVLAYPAPMFTTPTGVFTGFLLSQVLTDDIVEDLLGSEYEKGLKGAKPTNINWRRKGYVN